MNDWIRHSRSGRGIFALLLLCALAIRIVIPTGFMPTQSAHGIIISLCTGQGAVKAVLPVERQDDHSGNHNQSGGECVFAAGLGSGLITATLVTGLASAIILPTPVSSRAVPDLTVHRLAAPPPPSQAPPARA